MAVQSLRDATIYISDADGRYGPNTVTVDIETGDFSFTERHPVNIHLDRGALSHARCANAESLEFAFSMLFQSFSTHDTTTPYDAATQGGGAGSWVSAGHVADAYGVDIEVALLSADGNTTERVQISPAFIEEISLAEGDPADVLTFTGRGPLISPIGTKIIDGIVAYYKLGEASNGTRYDSSPNAFNLTDDTSGVARTASGKVGGAAVFESASSEYLRVASAAGNQFGDVDYSGCAWVYITDVSANRGIVAKNFGTNADKEFAVFFTTTDDRISFEHFTDGVGGSTTVQTAANSVSVNTWHFIKWRHDATNDTVEVGIDDNAMVSAATGSGGNTGTSNLAVGLAYDGAANAFMEGRMDEVLLTKSLLTDAEFDFIYHAGYGRTFPLAG